MKKLTMLFICGNMFSQVFAQNDSSSITANHSDFFQRKNLYLATVTMMNGNPQKGWLYSVNVNELTLVPATKNGLKSWHNDSLILNKTYTFSPEQINNITLGKKNADIKGILIGLGIGTLTGIISGYISGDDPVYTAPGNDPITRFAVALHNLSSMTAGEKASINALFFGTAGALVGSIISLVVKKKFIIGGKKEKLRDLQTELMQRLATK